MNELQQTLQALHRELAAAGQLDPHERAMLETAIGDIQSALRRQPDTAAPALEPTPADALDGAAVRLEAGHPGLAGALRALVDALGKAGI
jgi:hypothetical protein